MNRFLHPICTSAITIALASTVCFAAEDAPPPDTANILQALETLEKQHLTQKSSLRQRAYQEAMAAASDPQRAADLWEQARAIAGFAPIASAAASDKCATTRL